MQEAVRLVIWDLDETFWKGTITEGGISEYVRDHHNIIIELARRGIMSSICSKNDRDAVFKVLEREEIWDYFIFPSIDWSSKGSRLAALIDAVQLRPETILFIDDNPNNLAEARAFVPGIQVADETIIARILDDPRFVGKDDSKLNRLTQYKLLERRRNDELAQSRGGDNTDFLRASDVRVSIEYDVESNVDRAVELINRTNQLNFTKRRLSENHAVARDELLDACRIFRRQAGLIRVADNYGDYGFVGFFMLENGRREVIAGEAIQTLIHFCFSCRTLGMLVEYWLYERLGRPQLDVRGEVLTDLTKPHVVDWIREVLTQGGQATSFAAVAPEIRVHGGCEANALLHYLKPHTDRIRLTANHASGAFFVRVNSLTLLTSAVAHSDAALPGQARVFGVDADLFGRKYFSDAPRGTLFVISGGLDAGSASLYRHKASGWMVSLEINGRQDLNFVDMTEAEYSSFRELNFPASERERVLAVAKYLRDNYSSVKSAGAREAAATVRDTVDLVPSGSTVIFVLDAKRIRGLDGIVRDANWIENYNREVTTTLADYPFAAAISFSDVRGGWPNSDTGISGISA
jgi:FkbH-like protein